MEAPFPTIVYIMGYVRSGTTLLGNLLGQMEDWISVGERNRVWDTGFLKRITCGCGHPVPRCKLWAQVAQRILVGDGDRQLHEVVRAQRNVIRLRNLPHLLRDGMHHDPDAALLAGATTDLMRAISASSGARFIADSSKDVTEAAFLAAQPALDVRIVHLVRDPRGVAYSQIRPKLGRGGRSLPQRSVWDSAWRWDLVNGLAGAVGLRHRKKTTRVRYEDLTEDPDGVLARIASFAGAPAQPVVHDGVVDMGINHTVQGNPDRFTTGPITIAPDDRWKAGLTRRDRLVSTATTAPWLVRYGYPLSPKMP